jgi:probable rRNA maturation factor
MSEVINNQRKIKIKIKNFQIFAEQAIEIIPEARGKSATIALVSDRKMRDLNKNFPFEADEFEAGEENNLGDIIISVEQAHRQAAENDLDFQTEIKQLILHGILHLCGYDHETDAGEMNNLELMLREKLGV